ncbi:MAG TPA: efflux RND transporter periplasmic adaptor subunit [Candidatus Krumholzibacterium sp.]|nr:efflux RND transporter periplasmic adaptor subunit [Candidatus Krumholzibacterium sp.]
MSKGSGNRKGHGRLVFWFVLIIVVAAFALRFNALRGQEGVDSISSIQEREGRPVEVVTVEKGDIEIWTTLAGTVEGIVQYPIVSTNSIQVMDILRREGDWVNGGDVVIRLEKAAVNPMLHSYERSRVIYEDALRDHRRVRVLYQEGAVSEQALEKTEMALKIAESDLKNAREGVDLTADYPGVVLSLEVEKGGMANNGSTLAWIARTDTVKVVFQAGSRQAMVLEKGQKAVWINGGNGDSGEGYLDVVDLAADPESHLLGGEVVFPNIDGKLVPGLLLSFKVLTGDRRGVLRVPVGAVFDRGSGKAVYVVADEDGKTVSRLREIGTGISTSDVVEIVSGLEEGDRIVLFGQTKISDGDLVKVIGGEAK